MAKQKGRAAVEKKNEVLKKLKVEYVSVTDIKPNVYNPNRQSEHLWVKMVLHNQLSVKKI